MRQAFHGQLKELQQTIIRMGNLVATAIDQATLALARQDKQLAARVIADDDEIDRLLIQVEMTSLQLLALQQPMARDLRTIGTAIKIVTDLERMADHATDIAEIAQNLADEPLIKPLVDIPKMAALAQEMTREALQAYVNENQSQARRMVALDDQVDRLYHLIFDELMEMMQKDPAVVRQATYLLQVAMYLERIGDHATNLGEWTIYMLTGELEELNN